MDYVMRIYENFCHIRNINFLKLKYRRLTSATTREEGMKEYQVIFYADWPGYADDFELIFDSAADLQEGLVLYMKLFLNEDWS